MKVMLLQQPHCVCDFCHTGNKDGHTGLFGVQSVFVRPAPGLSDHSERALSVTDSCVPPLAARWCQDTSDSLQPRGGNKGGQRLG
jgi:hypothetical protein